MYASSISVVIQCGIECMCMFMHVHVNICACIRIICVQLCVHIILRMCTYYYYVTVASMCLLPMHVKFMHVHTGMK